MTWHARDCWARLTAWASRARPGFGFGVLTRSGGPPPKVIFFLTKPYQQSTEINQLLASGEDVLFMPRLKKEGALDGLIDLFQRPPQFVHIDQATLTQETL